jgi:hypothetical protein
MLAEKNSTYFADIFLSPFAKNSLSAMGRLGYPLRAKGAPHPAEFSLIRYSPQPWQ